MPSLFAPALERREFSFSAAVREQLHAQAIGGHDYQVTVQSEVGTQNYGLIQQRVDTFDGTLLVGSNDQLLITLQGYFTKPMAEIYPDASLKSIAEDLANHLQGGWKSLLLEAGSEAVEVRPL
jgi:hypothetical protein